MSACRVRGGMVSRAGALGTLMMCGHLAQAQTQSAGVDQFEVASIRVTGAEQSRPAIEFTPGGGLRAANVTLNLLIEMAYNIRSEQLSGGPGWADSLQFSINAKGPQRPTTPSDPAEGQLVSRRVQALLADRFHLSLARSSQTRSGYALVVAKGGPKMTESTLTQQMRQRGAGAMTAQGVGMDLLARFLAVRMKEEVIDRTGLTSRYDFALHWDLLPAGAGQAPGSMPLPDIASIFTALQEQLGLRLEREKVAVETFVIEHAEKPTEN